MNKRMSYFLWLVLALVLVAGCKLRPTPKVLDVKRADYLAEDVAEKVNVRRPEQGLVFLRVSLDAGADLSEKDTLSKFLDLLSLTDEAGKNWSFSGPGFIYDQQKNPNQIELFWSVPKETTSFVLDFGGERININAPRALDVYLPEIAAIPDIPPPEISVPQLTPMTAPEGIEGGVVGGPSNPADESPPPPPPTPTPRREPISVGILNARAITLPKPVYPAIARAAHASGTVSVQVTVDESGSVISARAVSGHPLLQQAAVQSAYQARFAPTLLSGQPVKVTGVIRYNFVAQ